MRHLIGKITVETTCDTEKLGQLLQAETGQLLQGKLARELDTLLDRFAQEDILWTINNITIELPNLPASNWEENFITHTLQQVEEFLNKNANVETSVNSVRVPSSVLPGELFLYYIQTGLIKENALYKNLHEIEKAIDFKVYSSIKEKLIAALSHSAEKQTRFIFNAPPFIKDFFFKDIPFFSEYNSNLIKALNTSPLLLSTTKDKKVFAEVLLINLYLFTQRIIQNPHSYADTFVSKYLPDSVQALPYILQRIKTRLNNSGNSLADEMILLWEDKIKKTEAIQGERIQIKTAYDVEIPETIITNSRPDKDNPSLNTPPEHNDIGYNTIEKQPEKNNNTDNNEYVTNQVARDSDLHNVEFTTNGDSNKIETPGPNVANDTTGYGNGNRDIVPDIVNDTTGYGNGNRDTVPDIVNDHAYNIPGNSAKETTTPSTEGENFSKEENFLSESALPGNLENIHKDTITGKAHKTGSSLTDKALKEDSETKTVPPTDLPEWLYVENAGLVILTPFLSTLFTASGLITEKQWVSHLHHQKAVLLTQCLVKGTTTITESGLILNKLLCGYPLTDTIDTSIEITRDDIKQCQELLVTVIQYWEILKNTSPEGLQQTFLMRKGKLDFGKEAPELWVEQKAVDILLGKLPWGISMIRTPWMDGFLFCNWA